MSSLTPLPSFKSNLQNPYDSYFFHTKNHRLKLSCELYAKYTKYFCLASYDILRI